MRLSVIRLFTLSIGFVLVPWHTATATNYGALGSGPWSNAATWTPAGGPPGINDVAYIGSATPSGSAATASVSLGANRTVQSIFLGNGAGTSGTLDLGSFELFASSQIVIGQGGGTGIVIPGTGHLRAAVLTISNSNSINLTANDVFGTLIVSNAAAVTVSAVSNITSAMTIAAAAQIS